MALEDRCSPQSAPSPPGLPHSPQSTSSPLVLDMSIHNHHQHNNHHHHHHLHHENQQHQTHFINQFNKEHQMIATEIDTFEQKMSLHDRLSSTPQSDEIATTIKEEENDSIIGDHDQEEDNDDQEHNQMADHQQPHQLHQQQQQQQQQLPMISFSITNILSDCFGKKQSIISSSSCSGDKKSSGGIFRPFEVTRASHSNNNNINNNNNNCVSEKSAFTRLTPEAIDYSRSTTILNPALMVDRANFLNCFNPAAYPRIHEEIINNSRKYNKNNSMGEVKMPPLGSLCKTVSQIGQSMPPAGMCISSPPPTSTISSASSASASPLCRMPSSPQPIPPQSVSRDSGMESSDDTRSECGSTKDENGQPLWPAWVYCTRYSDRPSSGPRYRRPKKPKDKTVPTTTQEEKRPRTAFSSEQLARLKREFNENRYLTERRRQQLSGELGLNEAQIKIWFQNKRAKIKKSSGTKNPLALQLMAQGLYNHSTVPLTKEEEELEMRMNGQL